MNRVPEGNTLSSFAIRNPQAVKKALQKMIGFTQLLYSCKSKELSFNIVEGRPYIRYSIIIACVYTWTSNHRVAFYMLYTKGLA